MDVIILADLFTGPGIGAYRSRKRTGSRKGYRASSQTDVYWKVQTIDVQEPAVN